MELSIYQQLKAAGCAIDSHESDLYVEDTETARKIIEQARKGGHPVSPSRFVNQITKTIWIDLPFCFDPWWEARQAK